MTEAETWRGADWPFIQNGAVSLFRAPPVLEAAVDAVGREGYAVHRIDCGTDAALVGDFARALRWQEHFGYEPDRLNLDALVDAMRHEPCGERPRLVLVLDGFDDLNGRDGTTALAILDIIEGASRDHLLHGERLLAFVRTDDPNANFQGLGARCAMWNPAELLLASRGAAP